MELPLSTFSWVYLHVQYKTFTCNSILTGWYQYLLFHYCCDCLNLLLKPPVASRRRCVHCWGWYTWSPWLCGGAWVALLPDRLSSGRQELSACLYGDVFLWHVTRPGTWWRRRTTKMAGIGGSNYWEGNGAKFKQIYGQRRLQQHVVRYSQCPQVIYQCRRRRV